ncbi:DNA polymerase III subunit psi [Candidatus Erwinia haradaeae]|uniref:DNA polymerase III subunit psi n=1 Tax=Candidatus Erwinia haradaeae TaxID=1922217 RepID=A0A451DA26_9GAMM|nr:DNA polymerase III subunit psi [Candidatus Erwinia haradaeae]VFP83056.1 DNA polymerase III subunit psi [Candidatus Erwinia haradaeae]
MFNKRNQLLQKIGITQYVLRKPYTFKDNIIVKSLSDVRLLIVSDEIIMLTDPLIDDILRTLHVNYLQVQTLTVTHLKTLPNDSIGCCGWFLGTQVPKIFTGIRIVSPTLDDLYHNFKAKRELWKQIYQYKLDIMTIMR